MDNNQKIQLLESFLRKRGLSLDDPDVKRFFFEKRKTREKAAEDNRRHNFDYGPIEPTIYRVDPIQFENSGYLANGEYTSLIDWYLYANAVDNSLVFDNLEKDQTEIRKSFEERRRQGDPLLIDYQGKIYNSEDGNHRLLSLIIHQFVEYACCKTQAERNAVHEKYSIIAECSFAHDKELCELLNKEKARYIDYKTPENCDMFLPERVREFRSRNRGATDTYLASYDPETKIYKYDFNGEKFEGTSNQLKNFLKTREQSKVPAMIWSDGKISYVSCNNFVIKSKNKKFIEDRFKQMVADPNSKNAEYKPYFIVFNADNGTYDITVPGFNIDRDTSRLKTKVIDFMVNFTNNRRNAYFFELCETVDRKKILEECEKGINGMEMGIDEMRFSNLSKEDYEYVLKILYENEKNIIEPLKVMNNAVKFDEFSEKLFTVLPVVDDANEALYRISVGLKNNQKMKGSANDVVLEARQTFNFGKTIAKWGYGRIKNGVQDFMKIDSDAIVMHPYKKVERCDEYYDDFERMYSSEDYLSSSDSRKQILIQISTLENQIDALEKMKLDAYDKEIAKIADEMIFIIQKDIDAGERLLNLVQNSSDSSNEKE